MYTLLYLKWIAKKFQLDCRGNSAQCHVAAWTGGESGGERTRVHGWLSPSAAHSIVNQLYSSTK